MSTVAIYQRPDGGLSLMPLARDRAEEETEGDFLDAAFRRVEAVFPGGSRLGLHPVEVIDAAYATDGDFRDAWRWNAGALEVDLDAARAVQAERLRVAREPLLKDLDVAYMRALEQGKDTTIVVAEKQRLRDLPALAMAAGSVAALRLVTA